jgi:hypothetical protein
MKQSSGDVSVQQFSTLLINQQMSVSNDEQLYEAARDGKVEKVKELLSKGTGTAGYKDEVS